MERALTTRRTGAKVKAAVLAAFAMLLMYPMGLGSYPRAEANASERSTPLERRLAPWTGRFEGLCQSPAGARMSLEIGPTPVASTCHWRIQYSGEPVRDYLLRHESGDRFTLDEQNGILIEQTWAPGQAGGAVFWSQFEVGDSRLTVREELRGDTIQVEMVTHGTRGTVSAGIGSFPWRGVQRCLLRRR